MGLYKSLEEIRDKKGLNKVLSLINVFENHEPTLEILADYYKFSFTGNFTWDNFKVSEIGIETIFILREFKKIKEISFYFNERINLKQIANNLGEFNIVFNWKDIISYFCFKINKGYLKEVFFKIDEEYRLIGGKVKKGKKTLNQEDLSFDNVTFIF